MQRDRQAEADCVSLPLAGAHAGRGRGRPRCDERRASILAATLELARVRDFSTLTIEAVAERAGVSKLTIYKWWPSKAWLALDACRIPSERHVYITVTDSVEEDLRALVARTCRALSEAAYGSLFAGIVVCSQSDPLLAAQFRDVFISSRRQLGRDLLARGARERVFRKDLDSETILDLIYGPVWHRLLLKNGPLNEAYGRTIVDHILPSLRRPAKATRAVRKPRKRAK